MLYYLVSFFCTMRKIPLTFWGKYSNPVTEARKHSPYIENMTYKTLWTYTTWAMSSMVNAEQLPYLQHVSASQKPQRLPNTVYSTLKEIQSIEHTIEVLRERLKHTTEDTIKAQIYKKLTLLMERLSVLQRHLYSLQGKESSRSHSSLALPLESVHWSSQENVDALSLRAPTPIFSPELDRRIKILHQEIADIERALPSLKTPADIKHAHFKIHRLRTELRDLETGNTQN